MSFRPIHEAQQTLGGLQDELARLAERFWHTGVATGPLDGQPWAPPMDVYEHPDHYKVFAEIPGVDPNEVEVTHVGATLTVRGTKFAPEEMGERDRALRKERRFGAFCRTLELPGDIDVERLSAKCHGGVLVITIPKSESSQAKSVKIEIDER